jgi:hypothetical protein
MIILSAYLACSWQGNHSLNLLSGSVGAKRFGTRHVLVLYDFPSSTRTTDLERIFEKLGDHGVAIRWVNDSIALAVFRTPSSGNLGRYF